MSKTLTKAEIDEQIKQMRKSWNEQERKILDQIDSDTIVDYAIENFGDSLREYFQERY